MDFEKPKKSEWKKLLEMSSFHTCVPKTTIIRGTVSNIQSETIFFGHLGPFFTLYPKTSIWRCHFTHFTLVHYKWRSWCMVPEISSTARVFCHFGLFFTFLLLLPLKTQKIKIWKDEKKNSWRYYILHINKNHK